jgi:hypothetical protein
VARRERKQGDVASLLDRARQAPLVGGAYTSQTTRYNLAALGHKSLQQTDIPIRDGVDLLSAELTDLFAAEELAPSTGPAAGTTTGATSRPPGTAARSSGTSARATGPALCCWCARFGRLSLRFICHSVPLHSFVSGLAPEGMPEGLSPTYFDALTARTMSRQDSCTAPRRLPAPVQPVPQPADAPRRVRH